MTRQEAIELLVNATYSEEWQGNEQLTKAQHMAIEALEQEPSKATGEWIPVKWHEITDKERDREGYPEDWAYFLDCEMPDDGQRILITTKSGLVELDECYVDGEFSLDSGYGWIDDVIAWMPIPEPYKESEEK